MKADNFILVGRIVRAHGIRGEVVIAPVQGDITETGFQTLFIKSIGGDYIPHQVDKAEVRQKSLRYSFFVKFARIDDRTTADELVGSEIYRFDDSAIETEETEVSFKGWQVLDERGRVLGEITGEMDTPAHPVIEITIDEERLMIPFVDEYIVEHRPEEKKVVVKNLDRFSE